MKLGVELVNPFYLASLQVFRQETGSDVERGRLALKRVGATREDMNVIVLVHGDVEGYVLFGLSEETARRISSTLLGRWIPLYDPLTESAMAEMGNVITGQASIDLENEGLHCRLDPPTVVTGKGVFLPSGPDQGLIIPLKTALGPIEIVINAEMTGSSS